MGATYTRQSTYVDGDTITAAHTNDEFDQLLAAFAASTGHTHDGTTGEGGPISTMAGHALTFGAGTTGTDIVITFDGETNDGVLKWMEDEDYFEFSDDLLIASTEKIQFRDTGLYINSSTDGQLDIVADTEVQIAATTIDINGNVDVSGTLTVAGAVDFGDAALSNVGAVQLDSISGDADTNTSITFSGSDVITVTTGGETQITFNNGSILPTTNNDVDLGSDSLEFKDLYLDGSAYIDGLGRDITVSTDKKVQFRDSAIYVQSSADGQLDIVADTEVQIAATTIDINGAVDVSGNLSVGGDLDVTGSFDMSDANITNIGSIALDTITNDGTDITLDSSGDIILDADGGDVFVKDAGTTYGSLTNSSGNLVIKSGTTTALTFSGANATLAGDLTISGDDLTMATNTAGALLIADGTNFNPTVVGDLSEISTVANDDVFLAIDTSGGGLKKISRSTVVAGLATSGAISNVVEDTSPQLGGNLDLNGSDIVTTSNATLDLAPNGTGTVVVRGNTNSGAVVFNCESNSHGQKVYGQPHSAGVTNTLMLPAGANSTLVSLVSTDTLTNKTLTSPVINTGTFGTSILPVSADGTTLGSASKEFSDLFLADSGTIQFGNDQDTILTHTDGTGLTLNSTNKLCFNDASQFIQGASATVLDIAATDEIELTATLIDVVGNLAVSGTTTISGNLVFGSATVTEAQLEILDGATVTTTELNIIDGGTSATSTTVADADRVVMNDNGTMVQVAVTDLAAYFDDEITAMPNLVTTGALNSGSITSGFGTIDTGSSAITTTGLISGGSLDIDNVLINGTTIGHTDDTDLITVANGLVTVAGEISVTTLDIGGTNVTSTAAELNILDGVTATTTELNLLDGGTSVGNSITVADADGFVVNDGGTMKTIPATDLKTYASGSSATKGFAIAMAIVFG